MASSRPNDSSKDATDIFNDIPFVEPLPVSIIALFAVSSLCLVASVLIQVVFWKHYGNSKILLCHAVSFTVQYLIETINNSLIHRETNPTLCYSLFVLTYYSMASSLLWISVMSYDVWLFLSDKQTPVSECPSCGCRQSKHRFLYYCLVAWGAPLLVLAAILVIDHDSHLQETLNVFPHISTMCWFPSTAAAWIFVHGPIVALCAFNMTFFALTVSMIRRTSRNCKNITKRSRGIQLFIIYGKLFAIMGIGLSGSVFVFSTGQKNLYCIGYVLDGLQGIAVFIAYFCNGKTYKLLRQKFCHVAKHYDFSRSIVGQTQSAFRAQVHETNSIEMVAKEIPIRSN